MRFRSFFAVAGIVTLAACGGSDGGPSSVRTVAKVTVSGANTALDPGQTAQLTAIAADAGGATITNPGIVLWASEKTTVATVDQSGKVTAVSGGNTAITADAAGVKGSFLIRVNLSSSSKDTVFTINTVAFSPTPLTVGRGATVIFAIGFDNISHDVRFFAAPGSPEYIPLTKAAYVGVSFPTAGTFNYDCPTHPQMTGTITVQ